MPGNLAMETGELPPIQRDPSKPLKRPRFRPMRLTIKVVLFVAAIYIFVLPLIPDFQDAVHEITRVEPAFLVAGFSLQFAAWFAYSLLTRSALGESGSQISRWRMFRIQMSTKALSNIVPGGSAAGSALGYRLLTLSGDPRRRRRLRPGHGRARVGRRAQPHLLDRAAGVDPAARRQPAVRHGRPRSGWASCSSSPCSSSACSTARAGPSGSSRWLGAQAALRPGHGHQRPAPDRPAAGGAHRGPGAAQARHPVGEPQLAARRGVAVGVHPARSTARIEIDALLIAFGLANIFAVIPITPGGLGIVEGVYIPTLVGFGLTRRVATLSVASYRLAQLWLPILLGGLFYLSLRVGPWSIERRDRLDRLRDIARRETSESERRIEFALRQWERRRPGVPLPVDEEGNIVLPFDVMPGTLDAVDGVLVIEPDAEGEYPGPFTRDTTGQVRRRLQPGEQVPAAEPAPTGPPASRRTRRRASPPTSRRASPAASSRRNSVPTTPTGSVPPHDGSRSALRAAPGGLRRRRRVPALAGQDDHRVRRPPVLHDHDEPPPVAHQRRGSAETSVQGRNVVVGNLVYSLVLGMSVPDVSGAAIANLEVETLQHKFPTFHGDTIHAETRVLDVKESSSKPDRGIVTVESKGFNQDGQEVCYFRRRVMVWKRDAAPTRARPYDVDAAWD